MPYAKTGLRAEKRAVRDKMRSLGLGYGEIAAELARRYQVRPRAAWREARGWSLKEAAERINAFRGDVGLDPEGLAGMTATHLCERENWPGPGSQPAGRKPTPYQLALLAAVYGCTVLDLVDLADREHLPPADLLIIDAYRRDQGRSAGMADDAGEFQRARNLRPLPGAAVAYRGQQEPGLGGSWIEREVLMTAHEGSEHAEQAERRDIGDATLEQVRADVVRLSIESMTVEPSSVFREMHRPRSSIYCKW